MDFKGTNSLYRNENRIFDTSLLSYQYILQNFNSANINLCVPTYIISVIHGDTNILQDHDFEHHFNCDQISKLFLL